MDRLLLGGRRAGGVDHLVLRRPRAGWHDRRLVVRRRTHCLGDLLCRGATQEESDGECGHVRRDRETALSHGLVRAATSVAARAVQPRRRRLRREWRRSVPAILLAPAT